jgi:hypothetical protein
MQPSATYPDALEASIARPAVITARTRWIASVTLAEALGYLAPACAGIATARLGIDGGAQAALLAAAGCIEGLALGTGQAYALPVAVRRGRYAILTALGAGLVWLSVMSLMLLGRSDAVPFAVMVTASVGVGAVGLVAIGGAQWLELRRHVRGAHRWIAWTALAWTVALPLSFAPSPLVDEATPLGVHLVLWSIAGLLMAFVMALITWQGARRLVGATGVSPRHQVS